jgi:hypothetical protein
MILYSLRDEMIEMASISKVAWGGKAMSLALEILNLMSDWQLDGRSWR